MIGHKDFPSRSGGVEVMVGGLARSLVERGYDVTVYNRGLEKHHNVYDVDGVHARRVFTLQKPALNATIYSFLATFDALFRGYDVLHYHAIGPSVPLLIAKIFGKHTVCTVHGLNWKVDKWRGLQTGGYGRSCPGAGTGMHTGVPGRNAAAADTVHPYKF